MRTALLLIDVQESFRHRPYWREPDLTDYLAHTHALIGGCLEREVPVVRILHSDDDGPFRPTSGHVRPLEDLMPFRADIEFTKHRHSAFIGTGLADWLHQRELSRVIVAGIRTEQCCETTARHACDEGFEVDFVTDATLTFDMRYLDGTPLRANEIIDRTNAVLHRRFATVCSVAQALERAR
jgi:nicotinamidase-related amidase